MVEGEDYQSMIPKPQFKYSIASNISTDVIFGQKSTGLNEAYILKAVSQNYKINDIAFDRTPKTQTINRDGKTINLVQYYEEAHKLKIKDENQPLIIVHTKDSQGNPYNNYYIPEFCRLSGLEDDATKDGYFMKELARYTKMNPSVRVKATEEFLDLLKDNEKENENSLSAKEKMNFYGIEIKPLNELFDAYYMNDTQLIGGNNRQVHSNDRTFPILKKKVIIKMLKIFIKI